MLVSVCIPVRNGARTIADTLTSVLDQDLGEDALEVVVSDNCSTDGTGMVVSRYLGDPRVRYSRSAEALELFASFQRAVELSRGDVFIALGADDVLLPGCISALAARLRADPEETLALVGCSARVIDASGAPLRLRLRPRPIGPVEGRRLRNRLLWTGLNLVGTPSTVLIRRSAFDDAGGFWADAGYAGDLDLWLRLASVGDAEFLSEELVGYRIHSGSFTGSRASGQVGSVLAALERHDRASAARPLRAAIRGVTVRGAWFLRRLAVRRALMGR